MENENRDDYVGFINQIKLAIFNIIASQEARLSGLADYLNSQPQNVNNEQLFDLYNKQRAAVSSLTLVTNDLSNVLSQIDYNDRVISELIANANQNVSNNEVEYSDVPQQEESYVGEQNNGEEVSESSEVIEENNQDVAEISADVGFVETPTDPEPVMEASEENTDNIVETTDNVVSTENVQDTPVIGESVEQDVESSSEKVETTDNVVSTENVQDTPAIGESVEQDVESPSEKVETTEPVISENIVEEKNVDESEEKTSEVAETSNEVVSLESEQKNEEETEVTNNNTSEKQEGVTDTTTNDEKSDDVVETSESSDETSVNTGDSNENEKEGAPVIVEPPVVEKADTALDKDVATNDNGAVIDDNVTDNVIQIKAESLDSSDDVSDTPIASLSDEKVDESSETTIDFVAVDSNFSRAILINRKQAKNLRNSISKQTESFNAFSVKSKGNNDIKITEENLEEMLEKATSLYSEEKVEEAEQLMQKIDEFRSTQVVATR